jgi:hypothetical protein
MMREAISYATAIENLIDEININSDEGGNGEPTTTTNLPAKKNDNTRRSKDKKTPISFTKQGVNDDEKAKDNEDDDNLPDLDLTTSNAYEAEEAATNQRPLKKADASKIKSPVIKLEKLPPVIMPPSSMLPTPMAFMPPPMHAPQSTFNPPQITSTVMAQSLMPPPTAVGTNSSQARNSRSTKKSNLNNSQQQKSTATAARKNAAKRIAPTPFNYADASFVSQLSQTQSKNKKASRRNNMGETPLHLAVMNVIRFK